MNQKLDTMAVKNNTLANRYEITLDGQVAELTYTKHGDHIIYTHTGVPSTLEGQGIGSKLAHAALEDAKRENLKVNPVCSFVAAYIQKHPEYQNLVG